MSKIISYTPGTKLCYNDLSERCTVITDGNVMITKGLAVGTVIKLADWLILANETEMVESVYLFEKAAEQNAYREERYNKLKKELTEEYLQREERCKAKGKSFDYGPIDIWLQHKFRERGFY